MPECVKAPPAEELSIKVAFSPEEARSQKVDFERAQKYFAEACAFGDIRGCVNRIRSEKGLCPEDF